MSQTLDRRDTQTVPRAGAIAALAAFLALVWYATRVTILTTGRNELLPVAIWGVAIVVGGMFLAYTWWFAFAVIERQKALGAIDRASALADQALRELNGLEDRRP